MSLFPPIRVYIMGVCTKFRKAKGKEGTSFKTNFKLVEYAERELPKAGVNKWRQQL